MKRAGLLVLCALTGCAFGGGSARVGQWMPRQEPAFEACLTQGAAAAQAPITTAAAPPPCAERKQVTRELPARRFWGVIVQVPTLGYASSSIGGERFDSFRVGASFEFLRGRGRWAYGLRGGFLADKPVTEERDGASSVDVTLMGHLAVLERLSFYAGLGYLPYSTVEGHTTSLGGRGLLGAQIPLNKTHGETSIVLSVELDHVRLADLPSPFRSIGGVATLGIFF